jgi:5-(carboxyamino)imidazole ribonucleotide mutase
MPVKPRPFVAVLMGSDSDLPTMTAATEVLDRFGITCEVKIASAHRTPDATHAYVKDADRRGCAVFIAAAGMAAHLAGAIAAQTVKPVIGVPIDSGPLQGLDALLSTVQMPGGVPVATVAIGKAGARNAAYLAAQMLALADPELGALVAAERRESANAVLAKDAALVATRSRRRD